jgi:protein SCO1/2
MRTPLLLTLPFMTLLWPLGAIPAGAHEGHEALSAPAQPPAASRSDTAPGVAVPVDLGGPFALTDAEGRCVTDADFRGRYVLLFFGYANCPGICPVGLQNMAAAVASLGAQRNRVTPLLITVDPQRDTPEALRAVQARLGPDLVALTGTPEALAAARRAYRVAATPLGRDWQGRALFRHGTFIYLLGPDGRVLSLFPPVVAPEALATALRRQLAAPPGPGS